MSPFSKVEMSPFVVLKQKLQHGRYGAGGALLGMSQRELTRLEVIQGVKRKTLKQRQAAELLSISVCGSSEGRGRNRIRAILVVSEIALSSRQPVTRFQS